MSHPIGNEHRSDKFMKNRVARITHGAASAKAESEPVPRRASGGAVKATTPMRADGGSVRPRADKVSRAKGGRVKGTTVNVIVSPKDTPAAPPMAAMPPPMPPKPPMMPPPPAPGMNPGAGGMPPPGIPHAMGGRAYKKGGAVKSMKKSKSLKMSGEKHKRAAGGPVNAAAQKGKTGIGDRTPIQHSGNKSDTQNIGRKAVITRATGGPIYADGAKGKQMSWNKPSMGIGGGGGKNRIAAAKRQNKAGHEPWNKDAAT